MTRNVAIGKSGDSEVDFMIWRLEHNDAESTFALHSASIVLLSCFLLVQILKCMF